MICYLEYIISIPGIETNVIIIINLGTYYVVFFYGAVIYMKWRPINAQCMYVCNINILFCFCLTGKTEVVSDHFYWQYPMDCYLFIFDGLVGR